MPETAELVEQHPELRIRPVPPGDVHAHNGVTWTDELGAYEWWEVSALDASRSGLVCSLHLGNAFDPAYRRQVRQLRAGRFVDASLGRKGSTAAIRLAVFRGGRLVARSDVRFDPLEFREQPDPRAWAIEFAGNRLGREGDGWRLTLDLPQTPFGWRSVLRPGSTGSGRIRVDLDIQPRFQTSTFFREFLPDSPSGATHDWLPACPGASVRGRAECSREGEASDTVDLADADGSLDHFRGTGPIGEGIRRYYIGRVNWPGGAAIGELIIIRKYIQLAPSLMIFSADESPRLIRGDRTPRADFQRSAWLLGYPMSLAWLNQREAVSVEHAVDKLADASPCRTAAVSRCSIRVESAVREVRFEDRPGLVQLIQPPRIGAFPWRMWCEPATFVPRSSGK